jgi:GNAT superfamily N-acetyltransferase/RimJ/RimL family protein N-acetyltransferase
MTEVEQIFDVAGAKRWSAVASQCVPVDHPGLIAGSLEEVLHQLSGVQSSSRYAHFVAVDSNVDAAYGTVRLPMRDNLENAYISISVLPSRRRRGVGSALAQEILEFVRRERRTNAMWTVGSPVHEESPGCMFSNNLGAKIGLSRLRRELDLTVVDESELDALVQTRMGERARDYQVVTWIDRVPDNLVEDVAQLVGRMSLDTPQGDLSWEPEVWDSSRWREKENDALRSGRRRLGAGAVDRTGVLVAFTDIGVYVHEPSVAEQWNTIVHPDNRGHRLGLGVKAANLRNLRKKVPESLRLETWNAIESSRMVAINELLGYRVVERVDEYKLAL